jgi:hypothetical protein
VRNAARECKTLFGIEPEEKLPMVAAAKARDAAIRSGLYYEKPAPKPDFAALVARGEFRERRRLSSR